MGVVPSRVESRVCWLAWSIFWLGFHYLGSIQAWVFGDHTNKPALFDVIQPLHFWIPWAMFMSPLFISTQPLSTLWPDYPGWIIHLAALFWVLVISRLIVFAQDSLHAKQGPWVTAGSIGGSVAALFLMRVSARESPNAPDALGVGDASMLFLVGLVVATWIYVLVGMLAVAFRWGRQRRQGVAGTLPL